MFSENIFVVGIRKRLNAMMLLESSPFKIASGCALGVFVSLLPIAGLQTVLIILLAMTLKVNKVAALLASTIMNPITFVFIYILNLRVGLYLVPSDSALSMNEIHILLKFKDIATIASYADLLILPLCVGSIVVATISAMLTYGCVYMFYRLKKNLSLRESVVVRNETNSNI